MRSLVCVLFTLLPASAYAVCTVHPTPGVGNFTTITAALGCTPPNLPILLLSDITENVSISGDTVIDGDGFTLSPASPGSVVTVQLGNVVLHDLTITGGVANFGGGLKVEEGAVVALHDVEITDNTAINGGGIGTHGALLVADSFIHGNDALDSGGGIAAVRNDLRKNVVISGSTIEGNTALGDGGGILVFEMLLTMGFSDVLENKAEGSGGGLFAAADSTDIDETSGVAITTSAINANTASGNGGGVSVDEGGLVITRSRVFENDAGLAGGGVHYDCNAALGIANSTISENLAEEGGGLWMDGIGNQELVFLTVADNLATTSDQLHSESQFLAAKGMAFGETGVDNGNDDCFAVAGTVQGTVSVDGTCKSTHPSNLQAPLDVTGGSGVYLPAAGSALQGFVPGAFCPTGDQLGAGRASPCDGGAVEN